MFVGQILDNKKPHLRIEEILICADGKKVLIVKPVYERSILNDCARPKPTFAEELTKLGYLLEEV